ncbi:MAG: TonB-dependent receptor [Hahellaceae bacterium]|nr:TonB-dependent receptor [Hahellaceae bacterium]
MPLSRLALAVALSTRALIAFAEENKETQPVKLDDVIVTATKEGEVSLQQVPLAISAFTGEDLEASGVKNLEDLQYQTPGLNLTRNGQATRLYLRGIGTNLDFIGSDPSVTLHTDGVYQSRTSTVLNDLFDVERVEVLRGPQGTLYGRNSIGGTINVVSSLPTEETEARVAADVGNYQQTRVEAMASGALAAPQLLGRIAVLKADHDPYVDNLNPNGIEGLMDDDTFSSKGSLRYLMGDRGEFILRGDYTQIDRATGAYKPTGLDLVGNPSPLSGATNVPTDPREMNISYASPFVDLQDRGTSGELQYRLTPSTTLVSITGYRDLDFHTIEDTDGSDLNVMVTELDDQQDQLSEELRLQTVAGPWSTVLGLFYLEEDHRANTTVNLNAAGLANNFIAGNETTAYAAFAQATYAFTQRLNAMLGLRYSYEEKHFTNLNTVRNTTGATVSSFQVDETVDWDDVSPKAGLITRSRKGLWSTRQSARALKVEALI